MRVLVTGATGFIGGNLVRTLFDDAHDVAMTRTPQHSRGSGVAVRDDVANSRSVRAERTEHGPERNCGPDSGGDPDGRRHEPDDQTLADHCHRDLSFGAADRSE